MKELIFRHELKNGLRILHRDAPGEIVHCAVLIDAGTRDEPEACEGLAHFIEHALFKGTKKLRPLQVLSRLDAVGGELNAWTTKEETCLYTSSSKQHLARSLDLLADILLRSTFDAKELEKEKEVIAEEIRMYLDSPAELILDDFETMIYGRHPLGRNILGTEKGLGKLRRSDLQRFTREHYHAGRIILCTTGAVDPAVVVKLAEKHFAALPSSGKMRERKRFRSYKPTRKVQQRDVHQAHCVLGGLAPDALHPDRTAASLLLNLLGGPAMNSRLNIAIRERNGLAYAVEAAYSSWTDNGIFHIYYGTEARNRDRCSAIVEKELKKLRDKKLSTGQLQAAKRQMRGQLALAQDGKLNMIIGYAKSLLLHDRLISMEEQDKRIQSLDASEMLRVANEMLDPKQFSELSFVDKV